MSLEMNLVHLKENARRHLEFVDSGDASWKCIRHACADTSMITGMLNVIYAGAVGAFYSLFYNNIKKSSRIWNFADLLRVLMYPLFMRVSMN